MPQKYDYFGGRPRRVREKNGGGGLWFGIFGVILQALPLRGGGGDIVLMTDFRSFFSGLARRDVAADVPAWRSLCANVVALALNVLAVYVVYAVCRLAFVLANLGSYPDLTAAHALDLFAAGLVFDTSAVLYTNALFVLLFLVPLPWKERRGFYAVVRWLFVLVNGVCVAANLIDCVYFRFTGKRTTVSVLQEFSHEGAGNMANIFFEQFVANWPLVLLFVVLLWALWRAYRAPSPCRFPRGEAVTWRRAWPHCAVNVLCLVVSVPLLIAGMRGGWTRATRPITISNANQYVARAAETGIVLNTPFSLIRTAGKRPFVTPHYMSHAEAAALFSPVHQWRGGGRMRRLNVVVIIMESFGKQHFGFYNDTLLGGRYEGFTPFLDSLCRSGAKTWEFSYANGRKSIEGMPSVLSGLPNYVEPLFLTPSSLNTLSGLAGELGRHAGYETAFFHGAENGSMGFEAFARATGFGRYYGRTEYDRDPHYGGEADFDGTWAIWDEEFLQFYADRMAGMREPFMTAVFTATSHTPFALPARYKGRFPTGRNRLCECVAYSDNALRHFFAKARTMPWYDRTLFVITADHTSYNIDPVYLTTLGASAVPIILYAPSDTTLRGYDRERTVQQSDIMPTVLDYLRYPRPYVAFGQDMLRTAPGETFALHWVPEADGYEYVRGPYTIEYDGRRVTAAYRHRDDPLLRRDIRTAMPPDTLRDLQRHAEAVIQQYMERMNGDSLTVR